MDKQTKNEQNRIGGNGKITTENVKSETTTTKNNQTNKQEKQSKKKNYMKRKRYE